MVSHRFVCSRDHLQESALCLQTRRFRALNSGFQAFGKYLYPLSHRQTHFWFLGDILFCVLCCPLLRVSCVSSCLSQWRARAKKSRRRCNEKMTLGIHFLPSSFGERSPHGTQAPGQERSASTSFFLLRLIPLRDRVQEPSHVLFDLLFK